MRNNILSPANETRSFDSLPFVRPGATLWNPKRTGSYASDCKLGREYANLLIAHMEKGGTPLLLPHVMRDMGNAWGGVEIGFATEIAERLIS